MPKFCSNCGAEVKEGYKFCLSCGKEIKGKPAKSQPTQTQQPQAQPQPTQPQQAAPPPVAPQQTYAPMQPKKSNTKLILGIIIAIAVIVVILAVVLLFVGGGSIGGNSESDFVGTWESSVADIWTYQWVFNSDKTIKYGLEEYVFDVGTWEVVNGKLRLTITMIGSDLVSQDYDCVFSNGGNTLDLKVNGVTMYSMTKT